jgi:hypothetical protein
MRTSQRRRNQSNFVWPNEIAVIASLRWTLEESLTGKSLHINLRRLTAHILHLTRARRLL